jgi:steroid delta-isomerase-like uncharacterized protein
MEVAMKSSRVSLRLFAAGFLFAAVGGVHPAAAADMFQTLVAAWNAHDTDKIAAMFTSDALYEDVTLGMKSRGSEEIRRFAKFTFDAVPDIKIELTSSFSAGGHGYSEWVLSGTDVGIFKTNKKFVVRGASINDIVGDRFARNLDYYDLSTVMKQVGLLPSHPEQGDPPAR